MYILKTYKFVFKKCNALDRTNDWTRQSFYNKVTRLREVAEEDLGSRNMFYCSL